MKAQLFDVTYNQTERANRGAMTAYVLMVLSWMFDFQSEGAGSGLAIQIFFLLNFFIFFIIYLYLDHAPRQSINGLRLFSSCVGIYLIVSITSGVLDGQHAYPIFRHALTLTIYLISAYATVRLVVSSDYVRLRKVLGWMCFGYAVSAFFIVLMFKGGVDVNTVRYEIQGTSSIAAIGLLVIAFVLPLHTIEKLAMAGALSVIFLTITRTYLAIFAVQGLAMLFMFSRVLQPRLALGIFFAIGVGIIFVSLGGDVLNRWIERMFAVDKFAGIDPTLLTRYIEWNYMTSALFSSGDTFLFGNGLAAPTVYWLPRELGGMGWEHGSIGFGHNQHLSLLFTGGIVGGLPILLVQFYMGFLGVRFLARANKTQGIDIDLLFLGCWGTTIVVGFIASDFLSSGFVLRGFATWYGIGIGLILGVWHLTRTSGASDRHQTINRLGRARQTAPPYHDE